MILRQLAKIGYIRKNKIAIEIIRNIELIYFLKKEKIKEQQNIIFEKLEGNKRLDPFIKYLKNILFKMDYSLYNYEDLFTLNNVDLNKIYTEKIYLTNNICESVKGKISYYLPKKSTNNVDFVKQVLINYLLNL